MMKKPKEKKGTGNFLAKIIEDMDKLDKQNLSNWKKGEPKTKVSIKMMLRGKEK